MIDVREPWVRVQNVSVPILGVPNDAPMWAEWEAKLPILWVDSYPLCSESLPQLVHAGELPPGQRKYSRLTEVA